MAAVCGNYLTVTHVCTVYMYSSDLMKTMIK